MLNQQGFTKLSDLYGIGAILYEFVVGESPFYSDDIPTIYKNIKNGKLTFPSNLSSDIKNLIKRLLEKNPKNRIGA
jgi:serum/glucocorticoid-regulated kinase 2